MNEREQRALLELFAVVDGVCTEPDLFLAERLNVGLGRIYRQWRRCRDVLARQSYQPYQQRIPSEAPGEHQHIEGTATLLDGEHLGSEDQRNTPDIT